MLTPVWLLRHLGLLALVLGMLWLGDWQLGRADGTARSWQNYGYAAQWWLFAAFTVFAWAKLIRDAYDDPAAEGADEAEPAPALPAELGYRPPPPPVEEHDDELAAYNRYLAELNSRRAQGRT